MVKHNVDTVARECIAVRMRMLNRAITKIYDDALRPLGIKISQMNVLVAAGKLGVARPAELCARLHLDVSTLSRNVERMKANGWLEAVADDDGRAQPFRLTAKGSRLLERAIPKWKAAQAEAKLILGEAGVTAVARASARIPQD